MPRLSKLDKQLRDHEIWDLRSRGHSVSAIVEATGLSDAQVRGSLSRVAEQYKLESAAEIIKMELDRLDIMLVHAMDALDRTYIAYSNGRAMRDDDDNLVEDVAPVMKAIDTILKIMDRRSRYLGLDAPSKSEASISLTQSAKQIDLQVLSIINQYQESALGLSPEHLALTQTPNAPTITLSAEQFSLTPQPTPQPTHAEQPTLFEVPND